MNLNYNQQKYWENYLAGLKPSERPNNPVVTAGYAGTPEITDGLLALYLSGKKIAGSSIVEDFISANDPLPQIGNYWVFLGSDGAPRCILQTVKIVTHKFNEVPEEIAIAEGEGDCSLGYWKKVHSELYTPHLKEWGLKSIGEATVITEFFKIVYK